MLVIAAFASVQPNLMALETPLGCPGGESRWANGLPLL